MGEHHHLRPLWKVMVAHLSRETLSSFGLSYDKHEKWVELASKRNAKKIRRKGRATL